MNVVASLDGGTPMSGAQYLAGLSPEVRASLAKNGFALLGSQSATSGPSIVRAVVRFDRPKAEVFSIITRPSEQQSFLPHVEKTQTVGEADATGEVIDTLVRFLFVFRYRTQHWFYPEASRMEWSLVPTPDADLSEQWGFWQLYTLNESTTVAEYGTRLKMRGALVNFLRGLGERGGVEEALIAFRKHVHSATP